MAVDFMYIASLDASGVDRELGKIDSKATALSTKLDILF